VAVAFVANIVWPILNKDLIVLSGVTTITRQLAPFCRHLL